MRWKTENMSDVVKWREFLFVLAYSKSTPSRRNLVAISRIALTNVVRF